MHSIKNKPLCVSVPSLPLSNLHFDAFKDDIRGIYKGWRTIQESALYGAVGSTAQNDLSWWHREKVESSKKWTRIVKETFKVL